MTQNPDIARRSVALSLRLTQADAEDLRRRAGEMRISVSEYVRALLVATRDLRLDATPRIAP